MVQGAARGRGPKRGDPCAAGAALDDLWTEEEREQVAQPAAGADPGHDPGPVSVGLRPDAYPNS